MVVQNTFYKSRTCVRLSFQFLTCNTIRSRADEREEGEEDVEEDGGDAHRLVRLLIGGGMLGRRRRRGLVLARALRD
jgi:hypothetical protein